MKSVLIIEDDIIIREATIKILSDSGFSVDSASNGNEGLKLIKRNKYDVILCDIMMPEMNGFEVLENMKALKLNSKPVFIYLTAKSERPDYRQGMEMGADDFIPKPFTREELLKAIDTQLRKKEESNNKIDIEQEVIRILNEKLNSEGQKKPVTSKDNESKEIKYEGKIFLSDGKKSDFVRLRTIIFIQSAKDYTRLYTTDSKSYIVRKPIKQWHEKLPNEHFLRIHRSTIINTDFIRKVEKWNNYTHRIYMEGVKEPFIISQSYSRILKNQIKGI
jgi:DNA-binding LytR/AlgR family response regulator